MLLADPALPAYKDVEWLVLYDRGRAARQLGQRQQARTYFDRSIADVESARKSVYSDEGRIGFAAQKQDVYAAMVDLLREDGQIDDALAYSERARGRAFVDLLASRDNIAPRELSQSESTNLLTNLDREEGREFLVAAAPDPAQRTSVVAQAQRSPAAFTKQATGLTEDGLPVHSFRSLLADLATLARNNYPDGSSFYPS